MKKYLVGGALVVLVLVGGGAAWIWFSGGSGEASAPVTAPPIEASPTESVATTEAPATTAAATDTSSTPPSTAVPSAAATLTIDPSQSEVRFILDEELRGEDKTVVGTTNQVTGEILFDINEPASAQLGTIVINVRTLTTDAEFRDRAIRSRILESNSDEFEFASFIPLSLEPLPSEIAVGDTVTLDVVGDLTLRDITSPVTFTVDVTIAAEDRLEGSGSAIVNRADFDLNIPSAPGVANVSEAVTLEIDFVAVP